MGVEELKHDRAAAARHEQKLGPEPVFVVFVGEEESFGQGICSKLWESTAVRTRELLGTDGANWQALPVSATNSAVQEHARRPALAAKMACGCAELPRHRWPAAAEMHSGAST